MTVKNNVYAYIGTLNTNFVFFISPVYRSQSRQNSEVRL